MQLGYLDILLLLLYTIQPVNLIKIEIQVVQCIPWRFSLYEVLVSAVVYQWRQCYVYNNLERKKCFTTHTERQTTRKKSELH